MTNVVPEPTNQYQIIKSKLLDGSISAISVDTCIFSRAGYRLEQGNLGRLNQFKGNAFRLIFSEITLREVTKHIATHSDEERTKLYTALRGVAKFWSVDATKQAAISNDLLQGLEPSELARKRVKDFVTRCGAHVIEAKKALDVSKLLKCYFEAQPPFEAAGDKKAEFPDAIALLSLESWAEKEKTSVLFVTNDKGCAKYCEQSQSLLVINDLGKALTLIQARDVHRAELCSTIDQLIAKGLYPDLLDSVESAVSKDIWWVNWIPEAESEFYYESEIQGVAVLEAVFQALDGTAGLEPVDFRHGALFARSTIIVTLEADCHFSFSVKDWEDKDMVNIGSACVTTKVEVELDVLLSFIDAEAELPELEQVELVPVYRRIDFGYVRPDYDDEDPTHEFY